MGNEFKNLMEQTNISEIMSKSFVAIDQNTEFSDVQIKFKDSRSSHILVVNDQKKLVGLVSQKYLYKTQSPRKIINQDIQYSSDVIIDGDSFYNKETLDSYILKHIMKKDPYVLTLENNVADAILNMATRTLGCVPVVDNQGYIKGVITHLDIVHFIGRLLLKK